MGQYATLQAALERGVAGADVIIDLSNTMRSQELDDTGTACRHDGRCARISRLQRLLAAWEAEIDREPAWLGVADATLHGLLCSAEEKAVYAGWKRAGLVLEVGYADPEILAAAEKDDASVLSGDGFKSFRRLSAWVVGNHRRFVRWSVLDGMVRLHAGLVPVPMQDLSRAEEEDDLRARGLPVHDAGALLGQHWRCGSASCFARRLYPERLGVLPSFHRGQARCPWCAGPLLPVGARAASVEVKVERDGREFRTLLLEEGDEVTVGRDRPPVFDATAGLPADVAARISRRHVRLRFRNGRLEVQEAGSSNGSRLWRWDARLRRPQDSGSLRGDMWTRLARADAVLLAGGVTLRMSGRRWPLSVPQSQDRVDQPVDGLTRLGE